MDKKELNTLMIKIQKDDEISFSLFYERTYKGVFSFIYSYVKNWHTAEDLLQETYIKVKRNAQMYRTNSNVVAWVLQIAKNLCLDYLKKYGDKQVCELNNNISENKKDVINTLYVHDLLNKHLKLEDRQIVILHVLYGYKNREIAKILNIPVGTVLWRYNKAIKELKEKIKED